MPENAHSPREGTFFTPQLQQAVSISANIAPGILHLVTFLQKYQETEFALSAYNAADTRMNRWVEESNSTDMEEFVVQIPFSETRSCVKRDFGQ